MLQQLEADARQNNRGLWRDARPIAPWDWRSSRNERNFDIDEIEVVPAGIAIVALLPDPEGRDAGREQVSLRNSTERQLLGADAI